MTTVESILAPLLAVGIPPGLIFFGAFVALWAISAAFGNAKKTAIVPATPRRGPGLAAPAAMKQQQARAAAKVKAPPLPKRASGRPQPMTVQAAAQLARQAAARSPAVATPKAAPPLVSATSTSATSDTARNLRLMLQHGGVRESILLAEILGPPKSMRE